MTKKCPRCGANNDDLAYACSACGHKLPAAADQRLHDYVKGLPSGETYSGSFDRDTWNGSAMQDNVDDRTPGEGGG